MGVKRILQGWGTLFSFLANVFTILSIVTNYWIQREKGHSGLWLECTQGLCSNIPCQTTISLAGACMVLASGISVVATMMGLRILCREDESLRGQTTSALLFVSGLLLITALTSYTAGSERKDDGFFSWSYVSGWLALPFSVLAGCCLLLADMILQSTEAIVPCHAPFSEASRPASLPRLHFPLAFRPCHTSSLFFLLIGYVGGETVSAIVDWLVARCAGADTRAGRADRPE
ncbi:claudin domain-containing protein 2 [Fukomys damarensis]|uniref:claudin domain-containing protein 2 n=1 Tax=Fukomys damarensis TaxID=885580 RepID=UPI00053F95D9|nr:claudin domain-containing protein 2 [Fukomys damarensis]